MANHLLATRPKIPEFSVIFGETRTHAHPWRKYMQELIFVGRTDDNQGLIFLDDDGREFVVAIDDDLIRNATTAGRSDVQTQPELGISVRDIQARIRRGENLESIASESGMELERIERFAGPVFAERDFTASQARETLIRRPQGDISLGELVTAQLETRGVDTLSLDWDSWRREDGRWNVSVAWRSGDGQGVATWIYDNVGRTVVSLDDEARWLFQESISESAPVEIDNRPRLVALPTEVNEPEEDSLSVPSWVDPEHQTIPVPVKPVQSANDSPSWDDILFGHRPTDQ